jgi:hypothetical protein
MHRECQSHASGTFFADYLQSDSNIRRSGAQSSAKMMKLKGFCCVPGYCLQSKACTKMSKKRENFSPFDRLKSGVKAKRGKGFPCTSETECPKKHSLFELVKWTKL